MAGARQLGFVFRTRGGARKGAGRPPKAERAGVSHLRRPVQSRHHPLHVTLRVRRGLCSLRKQALFQAVRQALAAGKSQFGFSLIQFSVQHDHLHLIAEANDRKALSRGMQGLSVRIARAVNRQLQRTGSLFADRYHARALTTPRAVRLALRYVLLNARKHAHSRGTAHDGAAHDGAAHDGAAHDGIAAGFIDSRSSAPWFHNFARPEGLAFGARAARKDWQRERGSTDPPIAPARTWLLRTCLQRHGPFDSDETPGGHVGGESN
jgi:putative transposase